MKYQHYNPNAEGVTPQSQHTHTSQNTPSRHPSATPQQNPVGRQQSNSVPHKTEAQQSAPSQKNQARSMHPQNNASTTPQMHSASVSPTQQRNRASLNHHQQSASPSQNAQPHRSVRVSNQHNSNRKQLRPPARPHQNHTPPPKKPIGIKSFTGLLQNMLPSSVYNPKSKKILGIFSAEDLLLIALIFLCVENEDENSSTMILALLYILVSEYIDLPDFSF